MATIQETPEKNSQENTRKGDNLTIISETVQKILNAFPQPVALLNPDEKVVTVNESFLKLFSYTDPDNLIGKKPEEIFNCIYAADTVSENQIADHCDSCGENLNFKEPKNSCQKFTERCNLTFVDENGHFDDLLNMKVTTSPFTIGEDPYFLFSITDISNDVSRRLLEKIFFHDVLNKAGNIIGILDILNYIGNDDEKSGELYDSLKNTSQDLINEIRYQRDMSAAENNELKPLFSLTGSLEILNSTKSEIVNSDVAYKKEILISLSSVDKEIMTDGILLRRVLLNMLKNALEATKSGGEVVIGCEPVNHDNFRFWVHNDTPIPHEIQIQLFSKSISTKGNNRGLGTFSMRLFGEKYLKGKVDFISNEVEGTIFMIDLPLQY
jgi:PAS domain-containing protein